MMLPPLKPINIKKVDLAHSSRNPAFWRVMDPFPRSAWQDTSPRPQSPLFAHGPSRDYLRGSAQ